jgi:hypothetical protein
MSRYRLGAAGVVLLIGMAGAAYLVTQPSRAIPKVPDPQLTPGAVAETSTAVICAPGFNDRPRVWHDKSGTLAKYGLPESMRAAVEDDDLIPRCAGGDNASPLNHWAQACFKWSAHYRCLEGPAAVKDIAEREACIAICVHMDDAYTQTIQAKFAHWPQGFPSP